MPLPLQFRITLLIFLGFFTWNPLRAQSHVDFSFRVPTALKQEPFSREINASICLPGGATVRLPAFQLGVDPDVFCVRARGEEAGSYRLAGIEETLPDGTVSSIPLPAGPLSQSYTGKRFSQVRINPLNPRQFALEDGHVWAPLGANLAWSEEGDVKAFYERAFTCFEASSLNWTRIWMCNWSRLNLDWLPTARPNEPPVINPVPGGMDLAASENWDAIVDSAERHGIRFQMVFQHHGQFSTQWDANWKSHPWNVANPGGFLKTPLDFFTDPRSIELTRRKYRNIVARWGYSPAIMAWELMNEVHNTDPMRSNPAHEAELAAWHGLMAGYLRSVDTYHHLITTSMHELRSPVYAEMDFLQPHLYASNMIAALRRFDVPPSQLDRPVFYGEFGDDKTFNPVETIADGGMLGTLVWASLMNETGVPAAPWIGSTLIQKHQLSEYKAIAAFIADTELPSRSGLANYSPAVQGGRQVPLKIEGGHWWVHMPRGELDFPTDGSVPASLHEIPRSIVGSPDSVRAGFSDGAVLSITYPLEKKAVVRLNHVSDLGSKFRISVDGDMVVAAVWPPVTSEAEKSARQLEFPFIVGPGRHTLILENPGGPDWLDFKEIDTGLTVSSIAAVGRRSPTFLALWVYQRDGLIERTSESQATLVLDDIQAGTWTVTWWDTKRGVPTGTTKLQHSGGRLLLPTPLITRHAALVLRRL